MFTVSPGTHSCSLQCNEALKLQLLSWSPAAFREKLKMEHPECRSMGTKIWLWDVENHLKTWLVKLEKFNYNFVRTCVFWQSNCHTQVMHGDWYSLSHEQSFNSLTCKSANNKKKLGQSKLYYANILPKRFHLNAQSHHRISLTEKNAKDVNLVFWGKWKWLLPVISYLWKKNVWTIQ